MEFAKSEEGIFVTQCNCTHDLLDEMGLLRCKVDETPVEPNLKLQHSIIEDLVNVDRFQRFVRSDLLFTYTFRHRICSK